MHNHYPMLRSLLLSLGFLLSLSAATAQQELSTSMLPGSWQRNKLNPALFPEYKVTIGLPGVYSNLFLENLDFNQIILNQPNGDRLIDPDKAITQLQENNVFRQNTTIETLSFGLRFGKLAISAGHAVHFNGFVHYPKTLPQLIWQGNAQFIGQDITFGPDIQFTGHSELSLGLAYQISPALSFGARAKYLNGLADASTPHNRLSLYTNPDAFELQLEADYQVNLTGSLTLDGFNEPELDFDFGNVDFDRLFSANNGFALDLGLAYQTDKWHVAASVLDLGRIRWTEKAQFYRLRGSYEYQGLDIAQDILNDNVNTGSILDTLQSIYQTEQGPVEYSQTLAPRFYLNAGYQITTKTSLGMVLYGEQFRGVPFHAFAVSVNTALLPWWQIGTSYAIRNNRYDNVGLHTALKLGPVQIFAASDNVSNLWRFAARPDLNIRLGLNLLFGKRLP